MLKKLRIKFILINMSIVTLMLTFIFTGLYVMTSKGIESQNIQMMRSLADSPEDFRKIRIFTDDNNNSDIRLPYLRIFMDADGEILSVDGGFYDLSDEEILEEILTLAFNSTEEVGQLSEYNLRYLRTHNPMGYCIVISDITSEKATLHDLLLRFIFTESAAFIVFLIISILLARWAIKPVDTAMKQQKQFIADASHELKTPLTVIMTNAELLNSNICTDSDRKQFAGNIQTMSKQMRGLVDSLLSLAKLDNTVKPDFSVFNLSELTSNATLPFEPVFFEKELTLISGIESDISINGSSSQIKQVIDILLDNAQKYSKSGGECRVSLKKTSHGHCRLEVSNEGMEIPKDKLSSIFERFYRVDEARAMNHSYGLGLAIAKNIIDQHGGKIWAESSDGVNHFIIELQITNK